MTADGSIVIQVRLDSQAAIRGASTLESHFEKVGQKISRIGRILGSVFAVHQLVKFGKEAIKLGSDLQEIQNIVDVTFGNLNREINEFAKNAVTQFGLSELSAKQFTSTMGAMLKSMGLSTREAADMGMAIAGLAGDFASFYNLDPAEAFYKIRSGISGEIEPLRQLGIILSVANLEQFALTQGITKSYNAMTQQEQALLRYNYLLSVTSDAQGDFARTSDSWANQTRILSEQFNSLKAAIGSGLISAFTPVLRWINTIIAGLQTVANVFRQVMALLFGKAPSSGAGSVQKEVSKLADGFGAAADGAQALAKGTAAAGKEAKKALLDFDTLNILHDNSSASGGGGGISAGGVGVIDLGEMDPDAAPMEDTISPQIKAIVDKILYYLKPLQEINFAPLKASLSNLDTAFSNLGDTIGDALEWAWFNILVPLATWTIEDYAPETVDLFTAALDALNDVLTVLKPYAEWLWDKFLEPIAEWTGGVIIDVLSDLSDSLTKIGDWAKNHKRTVALMALAAASFAAAWTLVNGAIAIWNGIAGLATTLTTAFGSAVAFLTSPIGLVILAIAALIFAIVLLVKNWDKVKEAAEKVWNWIVETWGKAADWFRTNVVDPIREMWEELEAFFTGKSTIEQSLDVVPGATPEEIARSIMTSISEQPYPVDDLADIVAQKVVAGEWDQTSAQAAIQLIKDSAKEGTEIDGMVAHVEEIVDANSGKIVSWITAEKAEVEGAVEDLVEDGIIGTAEDTLEGNNPKKIGEAVTSGVADGLSDFNAKVAPWQQSYSALIQNAVEDAQRGAIEIQTAFNGITMPPLYRYVSSPGYMPGAGTPFIPHMPRLANLPIPHLAKGTVIPPRAPFLAVLGDQRNGTNIEAPLSTIQEATASKEMLAALRAQNAATQEQNALLRDVVYMLANIDDAKIGKMANRYNRGLDRAYGR